MKSRKRSRLLRHKRSLSSRGGRRHIDRLPSPISKENATKATTMAQSPVVERVEPQKPTDPILKILNEVQEGLVSLGKDANLQAEKLRIVEGFLKTPMLETNSPSPGLEPRYIA